MRTARATERPSRRKYCRRIAIALLMLAMPAFSACFLVTFPAPPEPESPIPGFDASKFQMQKLTDALLERGKSLNSMQTGAVMEFTSSDQHLKAREDIVVLRPNNLRVEAISPFGVALLLAANGPDLSIFEPGKNRFIRGVATADTLYRYARIPMAPADAVGLLMGLAPRDFAIASSADSASNEGAMTVAAYRGADTGLRQLGFAGGNLAMVRETDGAGKVIYEVRYSDYHDIGGVMFPYVVDASFPQAQSHVTFRYLRPIINAAVPQSSFVLTPAPGATLMDLSRHADSITPAS